MNDQEWSDEPDASGEKLVADRLSVPSPGAKRLFFIEVISKPV